MCEVEELDDYILKHIDQEPGYLAEINRDTHVRVLNPRMLSGHWQGRVLSFLSKMIRPEAILELGTFTGYSALCLAEGLTGNGVLHTIECDDELEDLILENIGKTPYKENIILHIGDAVAVIAGLGRRFDLVFMDADKREYLQYYELLLPLVRQGGFILADNTLWDGKVLKETEHNDSQTEAIKLFNDFIAADDRVEKVMLPLRDGLTLIRKK